MSDQQPPDETPVQDSRWDASAKKLLDSHGYGFQFAVQEFFSREKREGDWWCAAAEFPVTVRGNVTQIDLVVQYRGYRSREINAKILIAAECKRVDPARGCWLFAQAPYISDVADADDLFFDAIHEQGHMGLLGGYKKSRPARSHPGLRMIYGGMHAYHIGLEMKTGQQGDGSGIPKPINEATTRALRGASGLMNHFGDRWSLGRVVVIPVIFTTAELRTTDVDLSQSDIVSGKVTGDVKTAQVPWLWFSHNRSNDLRHDLLDVLFKTDSSIMPDVGVWSDPQSFSRSIMVVSAAGLGSIQSSRIGDMVAGAWRSERADGRKWE